MELLVLLPLAGAALAGLLSGRMGLAAAPLLLPLLGQLFGFAEAVPLLTLGLLAAELPRAALGVRLVRWRTLASVLASALPSAALGAWLFALLPAELRAPLFGMVFLLLAAVALQGLPRMPIVGSPWAGRAMAGLLSGLTGSSGPLAVALVRPWKLAPAAAATLSATAVIVHGVKWAVYQSAIPMEAAFHSLAVGMGLALAVAAWAGRHLADRISPLLSRRFLSLLLALAAIHLFAIGVGWP